MVRRRNFREHTYAVYFVISSLIVLGACNGDSPTEPQAPTFDQVQEEVFTPNCALSGCHAGSDPPEGLVLTPGSAYGNVVGVPSSQVPDLLLVEAGNAADSYLLIKITGDERMAPGTFQMPIGVELSDEQVNLVEDWIDGGAEQ